ncbi:MAG TPA: hypothetical protein DDZ80_02235 [Cyanobacteria bacterium UBA8803]|nr:hypothetical protein [Cyanobacteria bacterium UBA9273]HBL57403.1 hypothetical protein [Cyanobacteria bacterium UBA8803]
MQKLSIVFAATLTFIGLAAYPTLGQVSQEILVSQVPPSPPSTPPDNKTTSAGGLDGASHSCQSKNQALTALIPVKNPVSTISEHPTFWFYIPYAAKDIQDIKFTVNIRDEQTGEETTSLYQNSIQLPDTPGVIGISLPSVPKYALAEGKFYRWYLKLYCHGNTSLQADFSVNGWVQRVPRTPENEAKIAAGNPDIWYDALTSVAQRRLANSQDNKLNADWANLLEFIERKDLAQEPLINPVVLPDQ